MPRSAVELLKGYDHEGVDVRDIGMGGAADADIAVYARQNGLAILTRDFDFADIRNYPPSQYSGLLVLALPEDAVATFVVRVLESFLANKQLIEALPTETLGRRFAEHQRGKVHSTRRFGQPLELVATREMPDIQSVRNLERLLKAKKSPEVAI